MIVTLERLKTPVGRKWAEKHAKDIVYIKTGEWGAYWKQNGKGYADNMQDAGTFYLKDALEHSGHCGPEKQISYLFSKPIKERVKEEFKSNLSDDAKKIATVEMFGAVTVFLHLPNSSNMALPAQIGSFKLRRVQLTSKTTSFSYENTTNY